MARKRGKRGSKDDPINAVGGIVAGLLILIWACSGKDGLIKAGVTALKLAVVAVVVLLLVRWWRRRRASAATATAQGAGSAPRAGRNVSSVRHVDFRRSGRGRDEGDVMKTPPTAPDTRMAAAHSSFDPVPARPTQWAREVLQQIEWKRFEELLEGLWQARGYRAEMTGRGADGGVDIRLYRPSAPDKLLGVIQCKSRASEPVGVSVARELFGVMHHEQVPLGILAASSGFTAAAREFAAGKHLQLWDGDEVLRQVLMLDADAQASLLAHVTRDDFWTPTCASCDVKMEVKTSKSGKLFYGCTNWPRCRSTLNIAAVAK